MSKTKSDAKTVVPEYVVEPGVDIPVIYADRVVTFGIGAAVSRLVLGTDTGHNTLKATHQIVIPTDQLIQALDYITSMVNENKELEGNVMAGLDMLRTRFSKK